MRRVRWEEEIRGLANVAPGAGLAAGHRREGECLGDGGEDGRALAPVDVSTGAAPPPSGEGEVRVLLGGSARRAIGINSLFIILFIIRNAHSFFNCVLFSIVIFA